MICRTFTTKETAQVLGISIDSVRAMIDKGILKPLNTPGYRFSRRDVYAILHEGPDDCRPAAVHRLKSIIKQKDAEINRLRNVLHMFSEAARREEAASTKRTEEGAA